MSITLTPTGGAATTFADPPDHFIDTAGAYWIHNALAQDPQYAIEEVRAPAVAGAVIIRHNFTMREIENLEVMYVNTSRALCVAAYETDQANMKNAPLSVSIVDDQVYPSCELMSFKKLREAHYLGNGKFGLNCMIQIRQYRLT